jgi:hypothetical protein
MMKTMLGVTNYHECSPDVWQSDDSAFVSSETSTYLPSLSGSEACLLLLGQCDHLNCVGPAAIAMAIANFSLFKQ